MAAISLKNTILRWPALIEARLEVNPQVRVHLLKGNTSPGTRPGRGGTNRSLIRPHAGLGGSCFRDQITGGFC
jgi:hypothetical protein